MNVLPTERLGVKMFQRLVTVGSVAVLVATIAGYFLEWAEKWRDPTWPRIVTGVAVAAGLVH